MSARGRLARASLGLAFPCLFAATALGAEPSSPSRPPSSPKAPAAAPSAPLAPPLPALVDRSRRVLLELTTGHVAQRVAASLTALAMLRETRELDLAAGRTTVAWVDLPDTIRSETVQLSVVGEGAAIVAQRFEETMPGAAGLEALLVGQIVHARSDRGDEWRRRGSAYGAVSAPASGPRPVWSGAVVSLDDGVVLRVGKELTVLPPVELTLADPARGRPRRRVLLEVTAVAAVRARLVMTGLVERLEARAPSYRVLLEGGGKDTPAVTARLTGSVLVTNASGQPMDEARLAYGPISLEPPRYERPRDFSQTWLAHDADAHAAPFLLPGPLRFDATGMTDAPVIDKAAVPITTRWRVTLSSVDELREKPDAPLTLLHAELRRVWHLEPLGLSVALPRGDAFVAETAPPGAPSVLGQAVLWQGAPTDPVSVEARTTGLSLTSRWLSGQARGDCLRTAKWEHTVPAAALAAGPVEIELPFERAILEPDLGKAKQEGVTLEPLTTIPRSSGAKVTVSPLPVGDPRRAEPRKIVVTYRGNRCK